MVSNAPPPPPCSFFPSLRRLLPGLREGSSQRAERPRHPSPRGPGAARRSSQTTRPPTRTAARRLTGWRPDRHLSRLPPPLAGSSRRMCHTASRAPSPGSRQRPRAVEPHRLPIIANLRPPCRRSTALLPRTRRRRQSRQGTRTWGKVSLACI